MRRALGTWVVRGSFWSMYQNAPQAANWLDTFVSWGIASVRELIAPPNRTLRDPSSDAERCLRSAEREIDGTIRS